MKNIVCFFLIIQTSLLAAQEPPKMLKYNAKNTANIFYYQLDEIPKKIKVKKEALKNLVRKELRKYNDKIKNISFLNSQKLQELDILVNSAGDQLRTNPDLGIQIRKKIEATIVPIRDSIEVHEKVLNERLKKIVSKKQYKKWKRYQKSVKRKLIPERPGRTRAVQPSNNMGRRQGQGQGLGQQGRNRGF